MILLFAALAWMGDSDTIALKEKATVGGRWIRAIDLVDLDRTEPSARQRLADLYLGRAPEEGKSRVITVDEIRRELRSRGVDPSAFSWKGAEVQVFAGTPVPSPLQAEAARAIHRYLLAHEPGLMGDEVSVRVLELCPEPAAGLRTLVEVRPGKGGYLATLSDGSTIEVVARISRVREIPVAARALEPGRAIEKADVELHRVELPEDEPVLAPRTVWGAVPLVRIPLGSRIHPADLRLRAVLKRGDVVRAVSSVFEVDARALEEGAVGQEISLEFVGSRNRLRGRVLGPSEVSVVERGR